jgi:uncharacterized membrane protein YdjX (TVP38/TMEM64 family)
MIRLDLRNRPTTEIVVILFTILICIIMLLVTIGVITAKLIYPEMDLSKSSESINNMLSTIIGALVGFISGRAYGRREEREKNGGRPNEQAS